MPCATPEQQREYQRKWMLERRQAWIVTKGPCVKCGSFKNLEVDHKDPDNKCLSVSRLWSLTEVRRNKELIKCQVLCRTCHAEKTTKDRWRNISHGSERMYRARGCRCAACCGWKSMRNAKDRLLGWKK